MGNETSRLSRLAKFTRIQKFSADAPQTVSHLKTNSFQGLLPNGQADDQQADAAFLTQEQESSGENIAAVIRDAAEDSSPYAPGPAAGQDQDQGLLPSEAPPPETDLIDSTGAHSGDRGASCTPVEISKSEASEFHKVTSGDGADATETASEPVKRNSQRGNSRHIEDGETKNIRAQSQVMGGRCSASAGSRSSGASQTPAQQRSSAAACSRGNSQESFLRRNRTHSLRTDGPRNSRGLLSDNKSASKDGGCHTAPAVGTPFPKRPMACKLSAKTWEKLEQLFRLMDQDGSNAVTREEARAFFKGAFSNLSADAMFNEVDTDGSGAITSEEFVKFWQQVRSSGYKEQDILDELTELIEGGTWVDWKDGRDTYKHTETFPKRPMLCRLSSSTWKKCEELFYKISGSEKELQINRPQAQAFFKGAFGLISADAMFNEIDVKHHGIIHAKDFMAFWVQVKSSGYKEKDILEEIECLMDGNPWVDWKDGRKT